MKKSLIAIAVASVMPMAAQADATLSGSVEVTYNNMRAIATALPEGTAPFALGGAAIGDTSKNGINSYVKGKDAVEVTTALNIAVSEVLANGMTATAGFAVADGSAATAGLSGDFGSLAIAKTGIEATMDKGDIGNVYTPSPETGNAIAYEGNVGEISVGVAQQSDATGNTQAYAKMQFQGIDVGVGVADPKGGAAATSVTGASYTYEGLSLTAGKKSGAKSVMGASYNNTFGDLSVSATVSSDDTRSISATYAIGDVAITAKSVSAAAGNYEISRDSAEYIANPKINRKSATGDFTGGAFAAKTTNTLSATYSSGDLKATVNSDDTMVVALDMGNADLTLTRVAAADATKTSQTGLSTIEKGYKVAVPAHTKLSYKVSF